MDADSLRRLRNTCIGIALLYMLTGAALITMLIWANGGSNPPSQLRSGLAGGGMMIFALFAYGIFRLCTIKRSMIRKRRDAIVIRDIEDRAARKPEN
jgi:hypothetical protein